MQVGGLGLQQEFTNQVHTRVYVCVRATISQYQWRKLHRCSSRVMKLVQQCLMYRAMNFPWLLLCVHGGITQPQGMQETINEGLSKLGICLPTHSFTAIWDANTILSVAYITESITWTYRGACYHRNIPSVCIKLHCKLTFSNLYDIIGCLYSSRGIYEPELSTFSRMSGAIMLYHPLLYSIAMEYPLAIDCLISHNLFPCHQGKVAVSCQ